MWLFNLSSSNQSQLLSYENHWPNTQLIFIEKAISNHKNKYGLRANAFMTSNIEHIAITGTAHIHFTLAHAHRERERANERFGCLPSPDIHNHHHHCHPLRHRRVQSSTLIWAGFSHSKWTIIAIRYKFIYVTVKQLLPFDIRNPSSIIFAMHFPNKVIFVMFPIEIMWIIFLSPFFHHLLLLLPFHVWYVSGELTRASCIVGLLK